MKILKSSDKKRIINQLNEQFGISNLPYLFLQFGKEKIRVYSGNLSTEELAKLDREIRIENTGLYLAKHYSDGLRLSLDSLSILKGQILKNVLEINDEKAKEWFQGNDLNIESDNAFKILKNNNELIGCGKSTGERITNSIPKERRVKNN